LFFYSSNATGWHSTCWLYASFSLLTSLQSIDMLEMHRRFITMINTPRGRRRIWFCVIWWEIWNVWRQTNYCNWDANDEIFVKVVVLGLFLKKRIRTKYETFVDKFLQLEQFSTLDHVVVNISYQFSRNIRRITTDPVRKTINVGEVGDCERLGSNLICRFRRLFPGL
jgi:hypothetical protein